MYDSSSIDSNLFLVKHTILQVCRKNQHVVPVNGQWGVKGEGNSKYTAITHTKAEATQLQGQYLRISNQNCLFMVKMDVFKDVTLMGVILTHRKGN